MTPRLVLSGPHDNMIVRVIADRTTRRYEELESLAQLPTKKMINCASNNYGGFSRLEHDAGKLIHGAISRLPFAPGPDELEQAVQVEGATYMGFEACELAPSGFSSNILAFRTVYGLAKTQGKLCIFLCDKDCHNSMFTGGFNNKGAMTHKFNNNDINGLEIKLRRYRVAYPKALVCVAVEGIYRYVSDLVICRNILIYIQQYGRIRGTYSRYPCTQDDLQLHSAGQ
jgi:serine palmitoyltransferase